MLQTILGSGGAIGTLLARALADYTDNVRLVSRRPVKVNPGDHLLSADLSDAASIRKAIEGSLVVYLTIGFPYDLKVWRHAWPRLMGDVIEACKEHGSRLVFFDNIYMYDPNHLDGMTEETPVNPSSRKGEVRARVAQMLMDSVDAGSIRALIARSADFYGPGIAKTSVLNETVIKPLAAGKKANWFGSAAFRHSYTFTPDAGKATALLGNTDDAYDQIWHLPTADDPPTGKEWVELIAGALGVKPGYREVPKGMVKLMGWFMPIMRELAEMMYQNDRDYVFSSAKFEKRFTMRPTSHLEGVRAVVHADYGQSRGGS